MMAVTETTENTETQAPKDGAPANAHEAPRAEGQEASRGRRERGRGARGGDRRPRRGRPERARPEHDQKIVSIRRVTRVVAGGRRFNFSVSMVIGNRRGQVGVGIGKGADTAIAVDKALRDAKKNLVTVPLRDDSSIPHETTAKFASTEVMLRPAPGAGLRAGSAVRTVLELAGVKNTSAKILTRSKNRLNNARAAVEALKKLRA